MSTGKILKLYPYLRILYEKTHPQGPDLPVKILVYLRKDKNDHDTWKRGETYLWREIDSRLKFRRLKLFVG